MVGNWVDQKTEFALISISDANGDLTITTRGKKHPIKADGDQYVVEISNRKYPLFYNEIDKVLSFNNIFYIRENQSLKNTFLGSWTHESKEESLIFKIRIENGGLLWEVLKNGAEPVQYYPKRTKEGFAFTYDNQQLFFTILEDCIIDSKGRKFCKS